LGLKWKDVDWLGKTIRIERGVVKQIVDDVKPPCSARTMSCSDGVLEVIKSSGCSPQCTSTEKQPLGYKFI
jgi:hypothetical protein